MPFEAFIDLGAFRKRDGGVPFWEQGISGIALQRHGDMAEASTYESASMQKENYVDGQSKRPHEKSPSVDCHPFQTCPIKRECEGSGHMGMKTG